MLFGLTVVPLLAFAVAFFFLGALALVFLAVPAGFGLPFGIVYAVIGRKVAKTRNEDAPDTCAVDCIIVNGWIQSPGTAVLTDGTLTLRPIVGENITVRLDNVIGIRETRCFNSALYFWKTGFVLDVPGGKRFGFCVGNSIAARWRPLLMTRPPALAQKPEDS